MTAAQAAKPAEGILPQTSAPAAAPPQFLLIPEDVLHLHLLTDDEHDGWHVGHRRRVPEHPAPLRPERREETLLHHENGAPLASAMRSENGGGNLGGPELPLVLGVREPGAGLDVHVRRGARARRGVPDGVREGALGDDGEHTGLGVELPVPLRVHPVAHLERHAEHHRRPRVELGRTRDRAAHGLHDVVGDGETQAGSSVLARGAHRSLPKRHEYELQFIPRDADAVVANFKRHDDARGVRCQEVVLHGDVVARVARRRHAHIVGIVGIDVVVVVAVVIDTGYNWRRNR